jgi:hypothetical protein
MVAFGTDVKGAHAILRELAVLFGKRSLKKTALETAGSDVHSAARGSAAFVFGNTKSPLISGCEDCFQN